MAYHYEPPQPDYRLDGFDAVDERVEGAFFSATISDDMFRTLASHHSADGRDSYLLLHDSSAIWGLPGAPSYISLHLIRDIGQRTFRFEHDTHPVVPLAQNWLIQKGCPPALIEIADPNSPRPADALTAQLEDQLKTNTGDRYEVIDHYTHDPGTFDFGIETRTLVRDHHPDSAGAPYRLFLEEVTKDLRTYTVREGAFASAEAADEWGRFDNDTPLPVAPARDSALSRLAAAARARSTTTSAALAAPPAPAPVIPPHPSALADSRLRRSAP